MANTYTKIYIHLVFSVKRRKNLIHPEWQDELYKYICGIALAKNQKILAIGGVADHIHILASMSPTIALSDLVRDIKSNSSKWINEKKFNKEKFQWQNGFGAFSFTHGDLNKVINYINNQEKHHQKNKFKDEYVKLLHENEINFDEKYLFDWIE